MKTMIWFAYRFGLQDFRQFDSSDLIKSLKYIQIMSNVNFISTISYSTYKHTLTHTQCRKDELSISIAENSQAFEILLEQTKT